MLTTRNAISAAVRARSLLVRSYLVVSDSRLSTSLPLSQPPPGRTRPVDISPADIASEFKEWFGSNKNSAVLNAIYDIIGSQENPDEALSHLNLRLNEEFVVEVLHHLRNFDDVLPCLKFFDWAGRQPGYYHTRATFYTIFKFLCKAKRVSVMLDWLQFFSDHRNVYRVRFYDTLVMGYAVAGKVDAALHLLAKMRFQGLDLNSFAYHVLLNSLVEENRFKAVDMILEQISLRGLENPVTCCLRLKCLFKQNKLEEAKGYILELEKGSFKFNEHIISSLVGTLCKQGNFQEAWSFVERFKKSGCVDLSRPYSILINNLLESGYGTAAMKFLKTNKAEVQEVFCYNKLIFWLLRENRFEEVYDLLAEMIEERIAPDRFTMNAVLCFFCKAGMVDVAEELYKSRLDIGFSMSSLTYNYLINALCGDDSIDEAYRVLEDCLKHGYFPSKKTFSMLADKLCEYGKLDKMSTLIDVALQKRVMLDNEVCIKYILSLCKAGRADEGYLVPQVLNKPGSIFNKNVIYHLINGLVRLKRGDLATELLLEKRKNGGTPSRSSYLTVIRFLCENGQLKEVSDMLEKHLIGQESADRHLYNYFIDGVGHAKKPEIVEELFTRMVVRGIRPNLLTKILLLRSFLKGGWIPSALNYFDKFAEIQEPGSRLYNTMIAGLCQVGRFHDAVKFLKEMRQNGLIPSLWSYEELVKVLCASKEYDMVVYVVTDMEQTGRQASSFLCNTLILQSLQDPGFRQAWPHHFLESTRLKLQLLVCVFSGKIRLRDLEYLDQVVQELCPVDLFTYNILLKELNRAGRTDYACELFNKMRQKGFEPNQFTYDIMLYGFCMQSQLKEAERLKEEMERKGFYPTERTKYLYEDLMRRLIF
ncbi:pentatricopeptide repeat-containing protein At1g71210, mitochondrial [Aristolochia californica]|uniref:pentatricopeptide repeat-containing protein At1g71210, mitochondrial n=1 Tax=Aristolochia californica TaxID=171875 RepID=UPI0035D9D2FB